MDAVKGWLTALIFGASWWFSAFPQWKPFPIERPAGALLGAVVATGLLTPSQAYSAIDHDTLALLLGRMLLNHSLDCGGVFDLLADLALRSAAKQLLVHVSLLSAVASAVLVQLC